MKNGGEGGTAHPVTMRPGAVNRCAGWAMVVFGLLFASAGLADSDDQGALVPMLLFGAVMASLGAAVATAHATVDRSGVRYRYGLIAHSIPASEVTAVEVVPGSGQGPRLAVGVRHKSGRLVRLTAMQKYDTSASHAALTRTAERMVEVLELGRRVG